MPGTAKFTILAIDDDPVNLKLLQTLLKRQGYRVLVEDNGLDIIEICVREKIDLILLDIMMPKINGFDVCKVLKKNRFFKETPVIFLTAKVDTDSILQGFSVGGADYITKPFLKSELLARVNTQLSLLCTQRNLKNKVKKLHNANAKIEKQREELIINSEKLKKAQEVSHMGHWYLDIQKNELSWSDEVYRIFEVSKRNFGASYEAFIEFVHPEDRHLVNEAWSGAILGKKYDIEHRIVVKDNIKWVREIAVLEYDDEDNPVGGLGTVQDITEHKLFEAKILKAIITTEESERKRFAEDLHDGIGALLSSIKIYVNTLFDENTVPEKKENLLVYTNQLIDQTIQTSREISNNLCPETIKQFGLVKTLKSYIEKINALQKIVVETDFPDKSLKINPEAEMAIYRIFSELINNTLKHSQAGTIHMKIEIVEENLILFYSDNGIGYNFEEQLKSDTKGHGLKNITTRIKFLNGQYEFNQNENEMCGLKICYSLADLL